MTIVAALAGASVHCNRGSAARVPEAQAGSLATAPTAPVPSSSNSTQGASSAAPAAPPDPPPSDAAPSEDQGQALSRLLSASWSARTDRLGVVALPMPDAAAWTRVRYWGVTALAGFRFGAAHHVAAAVLVFPRSSTDQGASGCARRFRAWAEPLAAEWDVSIGTARVDSFEWVAPEEPADGNGHASVTTMGSSSVSPNLSPPRQPLLGERHVFDVERRSLFGNTRYACAFAAYPAWPEACLVVGFAIPELHSAEAARAVRQRLARDALPALTVRPGAGTEALKNKTDIGP